ncbi:hypothetical protein ANME2D_01934 [Candidatus Methanoperedens nitroreducens]|uniref:Uncharacterized protein n=1 Tax=Candidatus Methanoperedens nitratireducens TaxID=1392998 RepID=A0A062V5M3_9EURY|nr:hypothetical protein ANME2D_01934 [Candidatus Methanoperedens nitroreducens]
MVPDIKTDKRINLWFSSSAAYSKLTAKNAKDAKEFAATLCVLCALV